MVMRRRGEEGEEDSEGGGGEGEGLGEDRLVSNCTFTVHAHRETLCAQVEMVKMGRRGEGGEEDLEGGGGEGEEALDEDLLVSYWYLQRARL